MPFQIAVKSVFYFNVMSHHYIYKLNVFQSISLKERKEEKNAVNLVLLTQKQERIQST